MAKQPRGGFGRNLRVLILATLATFIMLLIADIFLRPHSQQSDGKAAGTIDVRTTKETDIQHTVPSSNSSVKISENSKKETTKDVDSPAMVRNSKKLKKSELPSNSGSIKESPSPKFTRTAKNTSRGSLNTYNKDNQPPRLSLSWKQFISLPRKELTASAKDRGPLSSTFTPTFCSKDVVEKLRSPRLNHQDMEWCRWAVSPSGGQVVIGKSWGTLVADKMAKEKFDELNCNAFISKASNPSCVDEWGDQLLHSWRNNRVKEATCKSGKSSRIDCFEAINTARYCVMENVVINFDMMSTYTRLHHTNSRKFDKKFLTMDCDDDSHGDYLNKFKHFFTPKLASKKCDYVLNGTTLMYSHDDIRNLGHTMNDLMNVWMLMWLAGIARFSDKTTFLNIDSFNMGHNFNDATSSPFFTSYWKSFQTMLRASDFVGKTMCLQRVVLQSSPQKQFVWASWFVDNGCSFRGPSTLFQRFNLAIRHSYGLLSVPYDSMPTNQQKLVLVVVRKQTTNRWGASQTSRNTLNQREVMSGLIEAVQSSSKFHDVIVREVSFEGMAFEDQIVNVTSASIIIGMHGAGLALALQMSVGTKFCCGLIELFPKGDFTPIRGHGNMLRHTGVHYDRVDISPADSHSDGANVPVGILRTKVLAMLETIDAAPSCVLESVYNDPYFESEK